MAFVIADRVAETSVTSGTGSLTLAGAAPACQSFSSGVGVGNTCYYCVIDRAGNAWEVGLGTLSGGTTLARTNVLASSNANALVSFSGNVKEVFSPAPANLINALPFLAVGYVVTNETTTSISMVDLATPDTVTFTLDVARNVVLLYVAETFNTVSPAVNQIEMLIDGALDGNTLTGEFIGTANNFFTTTTRYLVSLAAGSHTVKVQHLVNTGSGGWRHRVLMAYLSP